MTTLTIGARFMKAGRMYFFDPAGVTELALNDWIIVRTDLGLDAARVQLLSSDSPLLQIDPLLGEVVRKATGSDVLEINKRKRMETDATKQIAAMALERRLPVKILGCDWQFDGASITVFYSQADGDARVDLGEFTQSLEAHYGTRIELRRLGARDETKVMTGVGTCGRELCCSSWLDKFSNISIRMAKEQDLPLNQAKRTGACRRRKCWPIYELETYQEVKGKLPKVGDTFHIPSCEGGKCGTSGCAMTQSVNVPKEQIVVGLTDGSRTTFTAADLGVSFAPVPVHTKGVGSYGSDEVPRQEKPTPVAEEGQPRRKRRRRGRRRGGRNRPA